MEELWERFSPLTPYGKDAKEERAVLADREELERIYDRTEDLVALLRAAPGATGDRIAYHLRRLPRLPLSRDSEGVLLDLIEIFQVKKFLANYRAVVNLLDPDLRSRFALAFGPERLAALLDQGGSDEETFYVADSYHADLAPLRAAIAEKDAALRRVRAEAKSAIRLGRGLDFGTRDFVVVPRDQGRGFLEDSRGGPAPAAPGLPTPRLSVEAYDSRSCIVRIQDGPEALLLEEERDELVGRERELEAEVLAMLSRAIADEAPRLLAYADAIREFDLARARALLAIELGCSRPELRSEPGSGELSVERGRFLPCERDCGSLGLAYAPLDLRLEEGAAVLFGSNMGGKTVALQSLLFFQTAAQAGLFVPAARFATSVYASLRYVGELREAAPAPAPGAAGWKAAADGGSLREGQGGLSGFGFEIRAFVEAWTAARSGGAFLVFDEFARTTSSAEAEAILSAAVESLAALNGTRSLFSTHFRGVARLPGVRYLRMRGLDRRAAGEAMASGEPVAERIRRINRMMRYEIVDADDAAGTSDAIAIAAFLGLDAGIAARATELFSGRPGAES
jgi:hypothetical protein